MSILDTIVEHKIKEVEKIKARNFTLLPEIRQSKNKFSLIRRIENNRKISIIGEIKRGSPSKGLFAPNLDAKAVAQYYAANGASCISV